MRAPLSPAGFESWPMILRAILSSRLHIRLQPAGPTLKKRGKKR